MVERAKKQVLQAADSAPLACAFDQKQFENATLDDAALQREILDLFDEQLQVVLAKLAVGTLSPDDCKFLGHSLRGSAAAIGALEIEALAAAFEKWSGDQSELLTSFRDATLRFKQATTHYRPE